MDENTCMIHREVTQNNPDFVELETIALDPLIWHGNGAGKRVFVDLAHKTFMCLLKKHNMTIEDHHKTFG